MYANIIIDISHEKLDKTFQYSIPTELEATLSVGMLVNVPFGRGNTLRQGYVVEITDKAEFDVARMKAVDSVAEDKMPIEGRLIQLAAWMKHNYGATMNQALKTVIPIKEKVKKLEKKAIYLEISIEEAKQLLTEFENKKNQSARARLMRALIEDEVIEYSLVTGKLNISAQTVRYFVDKGYITVRAEEYDRNPIKVHPKEENRKELNPRQKLIADSFAQDYDEGIRSTYLLYGITGSGKTEVYMEMIEHVIAAGRQVIMLIPEISLTYQTVVRFYRRFGSKVSIINSRMSKGERFDQFERAKNGKIQIMIGPRSALFTPFEHIGLIVIDEEHESSYKSETSPKYHARETAIEIARMNHASVVLGSATPSLEAYHNALTGKYKMFTLGSRATGGELPQVYITDLREELKAGNRSIFGRKLQELMTDRLQKKQQMMLFLNKRGYAGFVSCRSCGYVVKCPHCDISLTSHNNGRLVCHYCGYETGMVHKCPSCGSPYISGLRAGTQQIEEQVRKMYPEARVLRMDMDTTSGKDGHQKILEQFINHEADVLIGTQMIVKGHDFPDVTLVGILAADMSLYAGDYRAAERTFQLLTQAAGRAGRGTQAGEVVIQTYTPEHYSIVTAGAQDYREFFEQEIQYRTMLNYPPVCHMLQMKFSSSDEELLARAMEEIQLNDDDKLQVIGPVNAALYKANNIYNKVLYLKCADYELLTRYKDAMEQYAMKQASFKKINVQFDFDPVNP